MTKRKARKMAFRLAAAWVAKDADGAEVESENDEDDELIRKCLREVVVPFLEKQGT